MADPLHNGRRERFAQLVAEGRSVTDAYCEAGFRENRQNAHRLANEPDVRARIAALQQGAAARTEITVASITEGLMRIAQKGEAEGGAPGLSVARAALMDAAKLNGMLKDKLELSGGPLHVEIVKCTFED
ncbi:terminase small subunit [Xanthobacter versatilis]|uniref:hypothetical protein n=1 Tax=Xanthobacter autotrophicus (strain ATCC BAA-1158 / Py2) TaxID=78245 RepID=UPI00372AE02C